MACASCYLYVVVIVFCTITSSQGFVDQCGENKDATNQLSLTAKNNTIINGQKFKNSTCKWQITVPDGYFVQVNVFILRFTGKACNEFLKVYDGKTVSDKLIVEYCPTKRQRPSTSAMWSKGKDLLLEYKQGVTVDDNALMVVLKVMQVVKAACNDGNIVASTTKANFTSPGYPESFIPGMNCTWILEAPVGKYIKLTFTDIDVEYTCEMGELKVYDGDTEADEDLLKDRCYYSSQSNADSTYLTKDVDIFSYGQKLLITFKSHEYFKSYKKGFQAFYAAVDGGSQCIPNGANTDNIHPSASSGDITSPGFPISLPRNAFTCVWRLSAPKGQVIKLDLDTMALRTRRLSFDCPSELSFSTNIGFGAYEMFSHRCDNYLFRSYVSDGRRMKIVYKQEVIKPGYEPVGFKIGYSTAPLAMSGSCAANRDGTIQVNGDAGTIHSLNYPSYHPTTMTCRWHITVTAGQVIEFTPTTYWLDSDCSRVYVIIYDGPSTSSPQLIKLCSNQARQIFTSSNHAIVEFVSKNAQKSKGFFITYAARMAKPKPYACSPSTWPTKINAFSGKIASHRFPLQYSNNARCRIEITLPKINYIINMTFTTFDLEPDGACKKDYVNIRSGGFNIADLCGKKSTPFSLLSKNGNSMEIYFLANEEGRYPGFEATFDSVKDNSFGGCTEQFKENIIPVTSPNGSIFSPRYPDYMPQNMRCTWKIETPKEKYIRLSFDDIWLRNCKDTSVEIRDANTGKRLGMLCKYPSTPAVFFSLPNSGLVVKLRSINPSFDKGFTARYETVSQLPESISCGQTKQLQKLEGTTGSIASYEYPLKYQNNVRCVWIIKTTSSSYRFKIKFDFMDIEPSSGCKDDYVEIRDGAMSVGDSLGRFCGNKIPDSFKGSENGIYVEFKTNGSGRYGGFKLTYEEVYNVRTIVLISVFSIMGIIGFIALIVCICIKCCCSDDEPEAEGFEIEKLGGQE